MLTINRQIPIKVDLATVNMASAEFVHIHQADSEPECRKPQGKYPQRCDHCAFCRGNQSSHRINTISAPWTRMRSSPSASPLRLTIRQNPSRARRTSVSSPNSRTAIPGTSRSPISPGTVRPWITPDRTTTCCLWRLLALVIVIVAATCIVERNCSRIRL